MKYTLNILIATGIFLWLLASPRTILADCSPNQAGPVARPVSCQVGIVTYWCSTLQECQIAQNPALNNPPVQGEIGSFSDFFQDVNKQLVKNSTISSSTNFVSNLFTVVLPYVFIIAGLGLFVMLVAGGFQVMTAVSNPEGADAGKKRITSAFIGFFILFASYWLIQALEIIFGIKILS